MSERWSWKKWLSMVEELKPERMKEAEIIHRELKGKKKRYRGFWPHNISEFWEKGSYSRLFDLIHVKLLFRVPTTPYMISTMPTDDIHLSTPKVNDK